jgi:SAM-dependent methyltransferase
LASWRNADVCEIGCGGWPFARDLLAANGCRWRGVDPVDPDPEGRPSVRTHAGTVACLPFEDESFDLVLANQSLEHWHEFGASYGVGLREVHRVLRVGGAFLANVPIHLHGHPMFVRGEVDRVLGLFAGPAWEAVQFEPWRRDPTPLPRYEGWRLNGFPDAMVAHADTASTWLLDLTARKRQPRYARAFSVALVDLELSRPRLHRYGLAPWRILPDALRWARRVRLWHRILKHARRPWLLPGKIAGRLRQRA